MEDLSFPARDTSTLIIFKHIPKTGGTFLFEELAKHYRGVSLAFRGEETPLTGIEKEIKEEFEIKNKENKIVFISEEIFSLEDIQLIRAHTVFDKAIPGLYLKTKERLKSRSAFFLSCLRDPVNRFYSNFYHLGRHGLCQKTLDQEIDELDGEKVYEQYRSIIESCHFVGVTEYMDVTIERLCLLFGKNLINRVVNKNHMDESYSYRRKEIRRKLREVCDFYENYVGAFLLEKAPSQKEESLARILEQ